MFARFLGPKFALGAAAVAAGGVLLAGVALAAGGAVPSGSGLAAGALAPAGPAAEDTRGGTLAGILDRLAQQGVISRDQADKILAAVRDAAGTRARAAGVKHDLLADAAKILGVTPRQLRQELPGKSLAQVAQAHGVSRDSLVERLAQAFDADIDAALANAKITADRATALKAKVPAALAKAVDRVFPTPMPRQELRRAIVGDLVRDATTIIGITPEQLRQEVPGRSIALVAQSHGVSRDALVQKMTADADTKIDQARADGKLTEAVAQRLKDAAPAAIAKLVDHAFPAR